MFNLAWLIHKNELITRRADEIIEIQLFVRINLDIENLIVFKYWNYIKLIFNRQHYVWKILWIFQVKSSLKFSRYSVKLKSEDWLFQIKMQNLREQYTCNLYF